jgi:hypothetical protein
VYVGHDGYARTVPSWRAYEARVALGYGSVNEGFTLKICRIPDQRCVDR